MKRKDGACRLAYQGHINLEKKTPLLKLKMSFIITHVHFYVYIFKKELKVK